MTSYGHRGRTAVLRGACGRALAVCVFALALLPPGNASAGTYVVHSCDGPATDGWGASAPTSYVAAYFSCTDTTNNGGMVARNSYGNSSNPAPGFAAGEIRFTSPEGTQILGMRADMRVDQSNGWQAGVRDFANGRWLWCGGGSPCSTYGSFFRIELGGLATRQLGLLTICGSGSCPRTQLYGYMALKNVTLTLMDGWNPSVRITGGGLAAGGWRRGTESVSFDASDNVGVATVRALADGGGLDLRERGCYREADNHSPVPCQGMGGDTLNVNTRDLSDGRHTLAVQAIDPSGNVAEESRDLYVDNTAPEQPQAPELVGESGWASTNSFDVRWRNPAQNASPIAGARFELCPVGAAPGTQPGCVSDSRSGANLTELKDVQVPGPGTWTMRLWLRDQAGNEDPARSVTIGGLQFDGEAPTLAFLAQDESAPTQVRVAASDAISGIATAEIELRRRGDDAWRGLSVASTQEGFSAAVDDEQLPDGTYELRARAVDRAGNERSTDRLRNGKAAERSLPMRIKTRLAVGRVKRVRARGARGKRRARRVLIVRPRARFGRTISLSGRLTTPGANPVPDADIEVLDRIALAGTAFTRIASVRTSRTGRFVFKALRGPSRIIPLPLPGHLDHSRAWHGRRAAGRGIDEHPSEPRARAQRRHRDLPRTSARWPRSRRRQAPRTPGEGRAQVANVRHHA